MLRKAIALAALGLALTAGSASANEGGGYALRAAAKWGFEGPLGQFDPAQVQRGYKVYREVCSACHSMNLLYFRNLGQKGGPFYDPEYKNPNDNPYVKSLAKDVQVKDIDTETGDTIERPGTPADRFPAPFPNEYAARASNGGAAPPDLSVMAKARPDGPAYIYSLLTGYITAPHDVKLGPAQHYNAYFPGHLIGMKAPLANGLVTFDDKIPSTVEQQAKDVSAFLAWASDPKAAERKQFGLGAMIYLFALAILLWFSYKRVWRNVGH